MKQQNLTTEQTNLVIEFINYQVLAFDEKYNILKKNINNTYKLLFHHITSLVDFNVICKRQPMTKQNEKQINDFILDLNNLTNETSKN